MPKRTHIGPYEIDLTFLKLLDESFCRKNEVVLLGSMPSNDHEVIKLGMLDVQDEDILEEVGDRFGRKVEPVQLNAYQLDTALAFAFGPLDQAPDGGNVEEDAPVNSVALGEKRSLSFEREQSVSDILNDLLSEAVKKRATDIHIEAFPGDVTVRLRIDGVLQPIPTPVSRGNLRNFISHLKVVTGLDIAEHNRPQDGHLTSVFTSQKGISGRVDFRVSILPGPHGEDVVMRVFDESRLRFGMHELGMPDHVFDQFHTLLHAPGGILMVTGPSASGKTTSLYAALQHINNENRKILTVEDPSEYEIERVNQKQVNHWMDFADYSRAFMRQNPDVLMIGEVRDEPTAALTVRAAQIGHLILTTLHTRDALTAIPRIATLGVDLQLLAYTLLGVVSQRLVRQVCPECKEPYVPEAEILDRLPDIPDDIEYMHGTGCKLCGGSGYYRQTGLFEILTFDDEMRHHVANSGELVLRGDMSVKDFPRIYDDGLDKVRRGITTIEEVARTVPIPDNRR